MIRIRIRLKMQEFFIKVVETRCKVFSLVKKKDIFLLKHRVQKKIY